MKSIVILLNTTDSVKNFVSTISKYDYEMDLRSGRYVVNAKSLLGIFSLDLNEPVILEIYSSDCEDLINDIKQYICK